MKQDKDKGRQMIRNSTAEFLIFTGQNGGHNIEARYENKKMPPAAKGLFLKKPPFGIPQRLLFIFIVFG